MPNHAELGAKQELLQRQQSKIASRSKKRKRGQTKQHLQMDRLEPRQLLATFYVDGLGGAGTVGSDLNSGLSLAVPFATIQKAADVAQPGDVVEIRGGTYREEVVLPRSGTDGNPITFRAYNGEDAIISGGELVTGWVPDGGNRWRANVGWDGNTLFVDGQFQLEGREKSSFANRNANEGDGLRINDWGQIPNGSVGSTSFTSNDARGWGNDYWNGARVRFHSKDWVIEDEVITDYDSFSGRISYGDVGLISQKQTAGFYIYNSVKTLDQAGEWFKDGNTLYYQAAAGQNPNTLDIELRQRGYGFDASSRDYIHISGIDFRGVSIDTNSSTDHNLYEGNRFYAYNKADVGRFNVTGDFNVLRDNEFSHTWNSAVVFGGTRNEFVNNYLHNIGYGGMTRVLAATGAEEMLISHNTVSKFARSFLDGYPIRSEIAYNVFEDGGNLSWDTGVFDSDGGNGNTSYSIFHHNIFRDTNTRGIFEAFYGLNNNAVIHHNLFYDFDGGSGRPVLRASGLDFRQAFHNTVISDVDTAPSGSLLALDAVQTRYVNNIQITLDRMEALGVDVRGNHNYTSSDFVNFSADNYQLASGSDAIDAGIVLPGINDDYLGAAPDAGAFESGRPAWTAGHNFSSKPNPVYSWVALPGTNIYENSQFLQGIGGWNVTSGSPTSLDRNSWNLQFSGMSLTGTFRTQSVELTPGESLERLFTGLQPNTTYTFGTEVRVVNEVKKATQFSAKSGTTSFGNHRGEAYVTGLTTGEWLEYSGINFGDLDQFDQIEFLHIRDPNNFSGSIDGIEVQFRLDSPTGPLLAEFENLSDGNGADQWRFDRQAFSDVSGVRKIYVSMSGSNSANLALGPIRLLKENVPTGDLLTATIVSPGALTTVSKLGNEDWRRSYDELTFTTGSTATTAKLIFANDGRLNAYVDRLYLTEGTGTRGAEPREVAAAKPARRSTSALTSEPAPGLVDGNVFSEAVTADHVGSWVDVDLGQIEPIHAIRLIPTATQPQRLSNFRVSVWSTDPLFGGTPEWSQDYYTQGEQFTVGEQLVIQNDAIGLDDATTLGSVAGKFVRVEQIGPNNAGDHILAIADLSVESFDAANVAVSDSNASQSSTTGGNSAVNAIDGDPTTVATTSSTGTNGWWQTRFSQPFSIGQIELVNRDSGTFAELSNFTVSVWDEEPSAGGTKLWEKAYFSSGSVGRGETFVIDGSEVSDSGFLRLSSAHLGRVVRVQLNGTNNAGNNRLGLAEVRVKSSADAPPSQNIAQTGIARQSDNFYSYQDFAEDANNGLAIPAADFTSALSGFGTWWQIDLQQETEIDQIVLFNRVDSANRLNNFTVSVWDGDPTSGGTELWDRTYFYNSSASDYSTSSIGPGGALVINGSTTSGGTRLDAVQGARFVRVRLNTSEILSLVEVQVFGETEAVEPPQVVSFRRDGGSTLHPDQLNEIRVQFNAEVDVELNDLLLFNETNNMSVVSLAGATVSFDPILATATWDLSTLNTPLEAAYYQYQLTTGITDTNTGVGLDISDPDGLDKGQLYVAIPGDANLDGVVSILGDGFSLVQNLGVTSGATWAMGDFNGDGAVSVLGPNGGDGFLFVQNIGRDVRPPAAAPSTSHTNFAALSPSAVPVMGSETDNEVARLQLVSPSMLEGTEEKVKAKSLAETRRQSERNANEQLTLASYYDPLDNVFASDGFID